jgi:mutator protein MutT
MNCYQAYVLIILERDNKVLLLKRSAKAEFGAGYYSLVGGKVEVCEMLKQAILRETMEEVGISIQDEDLHYVHTCNKYADKMMLIAVFKATKWQGEPFNKEPNKHDHLIWSSYQDLPADLLPTHRNIIKLVNQGIIFSEATE